MSQFIFYSNMEDFVSTAVIPGRCPILPFPNVGDRVQLVGGRRHIANYLPRFLDKSWATVIAVTRKSYLIVEPDITPGEKVVSTTDIYEYNRSINGTPVETRQPLSLDEWIELRGQAEWLYKVRLHRRHLRNTLRLAQEVLKLNRQQSGTTQ